MAAGRAAALALALALGAGMALAQAAPATPDAQAAPPSAPVAAQPAPAAPDATAPAAAPDTATPDPAAPLASPVLTLDPERLFSTSLYGKRVAQEIEDRARTLAAENRKIEADLSAEERKLTDERAKMAPDAFRKLADAFDAKVEGIRAAQDAKNRDLDTLREDERQRFLEAALPILGQLVRDSGAVAILNQQAIFLSFRGIDVTDRAIARIDAAIGDGHQLEPPATAPADGGAAPATTAPAPAGEAAPTGTPPAAPAGN